MPQMYFSDMGLSVLTRCMWWTWWSTPAFRNTAQMLWNLLLETEILSGQSLNLHMLIAPPLPKPQILPVSHRLVSQLRRQKVCGANRSFSLPKSPLTLSFKMSLLLARHKALAPLQVGSSFRLLSREVCVGDTGFVLSHTLTFCFMWASLSTAAEEVLWPLGSSRFEGIAEVVFVWSCYKINKVSAVWED